jgi:hypothetical protein
MSDPLLDPLLERIARSSKAGMRLGSVTVIDATDASLTLSLAGDVVSGVRWIGSYTPVVADVVVVSRVGSMWVCLGKLSQQLGAPTTLYPTATVEPATAWQGRLPTSNPTWDWQVPSFGILMVGQGVVADPVDPTRMAGVWYVPGIPAALPAGATVTAAKLRLFRHIGDGESTLVTPRLRMHTYTAAPMDAPTWTGTAWSPGTLTAGQTGVWDLPSTWLTALLAGTATGVGVDSTSYADYTWFLGLQLELSYSVPA